MEIPRTGQRSRCTRCNRNGRKAYLCLKYQGVRSCLNLCKKAHVVLGEIPDQDIKIMDDEYFKGIYS